MRLLMATGLSLLLLAGCSVNVDPDSGVDIDSAPDLEEDWEGELEPQGSFTVRGAATALANSAGTGISVSIAGADANSTHPWHIHEGDCGDGGPIVGDPGAYPFLQVGSNGTASANASIDVTLDELDDYYVNIHHSPEDMGTIVSCGELDD
ncbi:MAG TPA: CHRD domain-containing protein [Longimicrobiaceae bacterium]|nr:CHRD domain-containing protein [Longimicrobiaceae bacterium]